MYLKSIEMQGFKSFAGKMLMEFHDGITGIVGPNGSGKSNVADAVRWVLGEQSAKQLRGGNMQDVIFSGTESRKPLGFASVAITLDNSDGQLAIDYPEVVVTRRLYRSGESEYLLNGHICRLKDINELFYDTGIGREGYSIIGQGQIDKILSSKPEDRRELFDEAAGIVKFKRRKLAAVKKLENEEQNLVRVTDILNELTKQIGPLEKQAEKAKIYLNKRDALKERELALFSIDEERIKGELGTAKDNYSAAKTELDRTDADFEKTKLMYESVQEKLKALEEALDAMRTHRSEDELKKEQLQASVGILKEKIRSTQTNKELYDKQIAGIDEEKNRRLAALKELKSRLKELDDLEKAEAEKEARLSGALREVQEKIKKHNESSESYRSALIGILNERSAIQGRRESIDTLKEETKARRAELTARLLKLEDQRSSSQKEEEDLNNRYTLLCGEIEEKTALRDSGEEKLLEMKENLRLAASQLEEAQVRFHQDTAMLESLEDMAEKYEGYGNSVRKVLEQKSRNAGIHGVVAELISTEEKYETAVETALGNILQNIVTDNEATAKYLIEYLKTGKYGRATFLPLSAVKNDRPEKEELKEKGIIGRASELVKCKDEYKELVESVLGRTYVVDTMDHAIGIGRRTGHRHRMVTLEGELFNAGGAMTGGAYKNNANLLGRKRQIKDLEKKVAEGKKKVAEFEEQIASIKQNRQQIRDSIEELNEELGRLRIEENTMKVQLSVFKDQASGYGADAAALSDELEDLKMRQEDIERSGKEIEEQIEESAKSEDGISEKIRQAMQRLDELEEEEETAQKKAEDARVAHGSAVQKKSFLAENIAAAEDELSRLDSEKKRLSEELQNELSLVEKRLSDIEELSAEINAAEEKLREADSALEEASKIREETDREHSALLKKREELSEHKALLDKECFRLELNCQKLEEEMEKAVNHLFEEYQMTPVQVPKADPSADRTSLRQEVRALKEEIRGLGSVNVNAVEQYHEVKERYEFLSAQHEDIVKAETALKKIITELDTGMRSQFTEKFKDIQKEFDQVFKDLFGGGKGSLELIEGEDVLDAGVAIIAQPPGKKLQNMMQLSGGEKALTAIALLFAIQNLKPSPFCLLDEIESSLDDSNVTRFAEYLHNLTKNTQFIIITHRRGTMTAADRLYGITMQEKGISTMVSVDLVESELK